MLRLRANYLQILGSFLWVISYPLMIQSPQSQTNRREWSLDVMNHRIGHYLLHLCIILLPADNTNLLVYTQYSYD